MTIEMPKDAEGREIPLDTVVLFGGNGNVYNIARWIYTTDFETWSESNTWRAIAENHRALDPELMYLTPPDTWEKLEEDVQRSGTGSSEWFCIYAGYPKDNDTCHVNCRFFSDKRPCERQATEDIVSRIRKLRGED